MMFQICFHKEETDEVQAGWLLFDLLLHYLGIPFCIFPVYYISNLTHACALQPQIKYKCETIKPSNLFAGLPELQHNCDQNLQTTASSI